MTYIRGTALLGPSRLVCDGWDCQASVTGRHTAKALRALASESGWKRVQPIGDRCPRCQPGRSRPDRRKRIG